MMEIRSSTAASPNPQLREAPRRRGETNTAWLARVAGKADPAGTLVLVGGAGLTDFRVRVAQSHARRDLLPSFWSHVALVGDVQGGRDWPLYEVSLEPPTGFGAVALQNGIQRGSMLSYDDPARFPNVAHVRLTLAPGALNKEESLASVLLQAVADFQKQRSVVDLPALMVEWLGFAWGVAERTNPLERRLGMPSAVFVQSVFGIAGIELTPGSASRSSCPEAIWQAAKWWHEFYASDVTLTGAAPTGTYVVDQPAASALVEPAGLAALRPSAGRRRATRPAARARRPRPRA
jgi:hypothetical protein